MILESSMSILPQNQFGFFDVPHSLHLLLGVSKKTGKPIKPRKPEKKITEKTEPKKKTD
jgi:hypothetical protein